MGTRTGNGFYARTPLWRRVLLSLVIAAVTPLALLILGFLNGAFINSDASRESVLFFAGLFAAISGFAFVVSVVLVEFWWRRHPPAWMMEDDDDGATREPDQRG